MALPPPGDDLRPLLRRAAAAAARAFAAASHAALERPTANGWLVKVHLAHLADWNLAAVAVLEGRHPAEGLGVSARLWRHASEARINAELAALAIDLSPAECLRRFDDARQRLDAALVRHHRAPAAIRHVPGRWLDHPGGMAAFGLDHLLEHLETLGAVPPSLVDLPRRPSMPA